MEFVELEDSLLEDGVIAIEDESVLALDLKRNKKEWVKLPKM